MVSSGRRGGVRNPVQIPFPRRQGHIFLYYFLYIFIAVQMGLLSYGSVHMLFYVMSHRPSTLGSRSIKLKVPLFKRRIKEYKNHLMQRTALLSVIRRLGIGDR